MEYTSFRKLLKALKSPSGGLKMVDRKVFFEFFNIKSIDRDSTFFVLMPNFFWDLKISESWIYMLIQPPRPVL